MIIHVPNKNTLIIDDFKLRCCVGKGGINSNKKEGDYSTPKGLFDLRKLYFENVDLTTGGLYTIEFTVSADNNVEGLFFLNPTGQWDPRISESILVTGTEQTFSFTMNDKLLFDMNYELLFQFGFPTNTAPTRIEFTNVTIYRQD